MNYKIMSKTNGRLTFIAQGSVRSGLKFPAVTNDATNKLAKHNHVV